MQLRITNFCVRGFYQAFLANASISPIAEPSTIPILVPPRIEIHGFHPLPSARLPAPNLKKRGGENSSTQDRKFPATPESWFNCQTSSFKQRIRSGEPPLCWLHSFKSAEFQPQILLGDFMLKGM